MERETRSNKCGEKRNRTFQAGGSTSALPHDLFQTASVAVFILSRHFTETQSLIPEQKKNLPYDRKKP